MGKLRLATCVVFLIVSCSKSNTGNNQQSNLQAQLQGKWNIVQHIALNFSLLPGYSDTTIPIHQEYVFFSNDTIHSDTWYQAALDIAQHPPVYSVDQTRESNDSATYTASTDRIVIYFGSSHDTTYVNKISSTDLVLEEHVPGTASWDLITVCKK